VGWVTLQGSKCKCKWFAAFSLRTKSLTLICIYGDCNAILLFTSRKKKTRLPFCFQDTFAFGSHLGNLCQNLFTLRWKSVIAGLCLERPQVFRFGKNFANRQNIKDAVVLGWGRQIFEKSSQTMGITAVTVNACQRNMKNEVFKLFTARAWNTRSMLPSTMI